MRDRLPFIARAKICPYLEKVDISASRADGSSPHDDSVDKPMQLILYKEIPEKKENVSVIYQTHHISLEMGMDHINPTTISSDERCHQVIQNLWHPNVLLSG